ncbi:MAG: helix-turn-helix transcriptional regulator [Bacteroidota bacterium]
MSVSERIKQFIRFKNLNPNSFSKKLGLTNNVTISRLVNENRSPSFSTLYKIKESFPEVNLDWLITGKGLMLVEGLNEDYLQRIKDLEEIIEEQKDHINILMETLKMQNKRKA